MEFEKEKCGYFPQLTGVRAVAAYLVYVYHTNPFSYEFSPFLNHLVNEFHIGVSIFFVLSGFLITFRYFNLSIDTKGWFLKYATNRMARVYPMYFIITTVSFLFLLIQGKEGDNSLFVYFTNITFLRGFFDNLKFTLVAQGWSLTTEECFYFFAPLLFIFLKKTKWFLLYTSLILILLGSLLVEVFREVNYYGFFNSYSFMFNYTFFGRCFEFICGSWLALYFHRRQPIEKAGNKYTYIGLSLMSLLVIAMSLFAESKPEVYTFFGIVINNFLLPVSISILFYGLIVEQTSIRLVLNSSVLVLLGKSSYTFYLIHIGFPYLLINQYVTTNYAFVFLILNIIAIGLWYFVEDPLNVSIRKI